MASTNGQTVAVFDFDNTLIKGDSLLPFLSLTTDWPSVVFGFGEAFTHYAVHQGKKLLKLDRAHMRTFIKTDLLENVLAGIEVEHLGPSIEKLKLWQEWIPITKQALLDHRAKGHHIVIASGGLDLYLPHLLKGVPYDALICTQMEVVDGMITGVMLTGNCVRKRKAEMVANYLKTHGPFTDSWGYGNAPDDGPMLDLLKHRIII